MKKGYRRGSTSATWQKLKLVTGSNSDSNNQQLDTEDSLPGISNENEASKDDDVLVDCCAGSDILVLHCHKRLVEIWDWKSPIKQKNSSGDTLYHNGLYSLCNSDEEVEGQGIRIICFKVLSYEVLKGFTIALIEQLFGNAPVFYLSIYRLHDCEVSEASQKIQLPEVMQFEESKFQIKSSDNYLIVSNNHGYVLLLKYDVHKQRYRNANYDSSLNLIHKSLRFTATSKSRGCNMSDDEIIFKTSCSGDEAIFDIVGKWFVFCPTRLEYEHLIAITRSNDKLGSAFRCSDEDPIFSKKPEDQSSSDNTPFITVTLPPKGPLLNRVVRNLSNSAADSFFKLSEASSTRIMSYVNKNNTSRGLSQDAKDEKVDVLVNSFNTLGRNIGKTLYTTASSTASSIHKKAMPTKPSSNQLIEVVDISNDKVIAVFRPPGGVSKLSLSPFDLQLVHSNLRGDSFFMWDLYKLPLEVSLLGKFVRGKTSATIKEIFWFINNYDESSNVRGNNSGFGCITKGTGSVHWFNINYLSGDHLHNHPNNLVPDVLDDSIKNIKNNFLDSWVLPSMKAEKFLALPNISNTMEHKSAANVFDINQLAILDKFNELKLISPLNGMHLFKYDIPSKNASNELKSYKYKPPSPVLNGDAELYENIAPLSQTEIETCGPYLNFINHDNIEFAVYDFDDNSSDFDNLMGCYEVFGATVPYKDVMLKGNLDSEKQCRSDMLLLERNNLIIPQNEHEICPSTLE